MASLPVALRLLSKTVNKEIMTVLGSSGFDEQEALRCVFLWEHATQSSFGRQRGQCNRYVREFTGYRGTNGSPPLFIKNVFSHPRSRIRTPRWRNASSIGAIQGSTHFLVSSYDVKCCSDRRCAIYRNKWSSEEAMSGEYSG